jgi:hypothetical protein
MTKGKENNTREKNDMKAQRGNIRREREIQRDRQRERQRVGE